MNFDNFRNYTDISENRWYVDKGKRPMRRDMVILHDYVHGTIVDQSALIYGADKMVIGNNCYIAPNTYLRGHITIGDMTWIGPFAQINGEFGCEIGRGVGIGNSVIILTCEHDQRDLNQPISFGKLVGERIVIGDGANIGVGSIILPGVVIDEGVQIGAGSVVTKGIYIGKNEIWAGNPARKVGTRTTPQEL